MSFTELASVDGKITPTAEATVPLRDDGLYRGDGAFEVIKLYAGRPFALDDHYVRLQRSAASIDFEFDLLQLRSEVDALLAEAGSAECLLRLIVTRGGRRIATLEPPIVHGESIRLATVTYSPTIILNGVKSLSYAANMQATRMAKQAGAEDALLITPEGVILEAPTSTIFWVSEYGTLRTTELEAGVLASITRDRVMRQVPTEEGSWLVDDILSASEAFLVSTTREVQAVSRIDDVVLPNVPGPRTVEAAAAFTAQLREELGDADQPLEPAL